MSDIGEVFSISADYAKEIQKELNPEGKPIPSDATHLAGCYDAEKEQEKIIEGTKPSEFVFWSDYYNKGKDSVDPVQFKNITDTRVGSYAERKAAAAQNAKYQDKMHLVNLEMEAGEDIHQGEPPGTDDTVFQARSKVSEGEDKSMFYAWEFFDTLHPEIKEQYFLGKRMPNLGAEYDVIGFEASHCLVRYNIDEFARLIITIFLHELVTLFKYPAEIKKFDFEKYLGLCINNVVFDIDQGTVLKLGEGCIVTHAMFGYQKLNQEEIVAIYGNPPVYKQLQWPKSIRVMQKGQGPHQTLMGYFESIKAPVICHIVDCIKNKTIENKSYSEFAFNLDEITYRQFCYFNEDKVDYFGTLGAFYPNLVKDPSRFILAQPFLVDTLKALKTVKKKIFLTSNSHFSYTAWIMELTLGEDWMNHFDLVICNCKKPLFQRAENPFFLFDPTKPNLKGRAIFTPVQMKESGEKVFLEGNAKLLTKHLQEMTGFTDLQVAFFGPNYLTDIQATVEFNRGLQFAGYKARWDVIPVIEELCQYEKTSKTLYVPKLLKVDTNFWGDSFFFDQDPMHKTVVAEPKKIEQSSKRRVVVVIPFGLPCSGKSSLNQTIKMFIKSDLISIVSLSSDAIRAKEMERIKQQEPTLDKDQIFEKSRQNSLNVFTQQLSELVKNSNKDDLGNQHIIYIDKNHPIDQIQRVVDMIDKNTPEGIDLKKVFMLPKIEQVQDRLAGLPFDVSFYLSCLSRALKRKDHPTLNADNPKKLMEVLSHFIQQLRYVHFDNEFLKSNKLDGFIEIPLTDNEIEVPKLLIQTFYQVVEGFQGLGSGAPAMTDSLIELLDKHENLFVKPIDQQYIAESFRSEINNLYIEEQPELVEKPKLRSHFVKKIFEVSRYAVASTIKINVMLPNIIQTAQLSEEALKKAEQKMKIQEVQREPVPKRPKAPELFPESQEEPVAKKEPKIKFTQIKTKLKIEKPSVRPILSLKPQKQGFIKIKMETKGQQRVNVFESADKAAEVQQRKLEQLRTVHGKQVHRSGLSKVIIKTVLDKNKQTIYSVSPQENDNLSADLRETYGWRDGKTVYLTWEELRHAIHGRKLIDPNDAEKVLGQAGSLEMLKMYTFYLQMRGKGFFLTRQKEPAYAQSEKKAEQVQEEKEEVKDYMDDNILEESMFREIKRQKRTTMQDYESLEKSTEGLNVEIFDFYPGREYFNKKTGCDKRVLLWLGEEEVNLQYLKKLASSFSNGISQVAFIRQQNVIFYDFDFNTI